MKLSFFCLLPVLLLISCKHSDTIDEKINRLRLDVVFNTITQKNDSIIYSCWDKSIKIFDLKKKETVFSRMIDQICYAKPIVKGNKIFYPDSDNGFACFNLSNGSLLWRINIKGRCSNFDFVADNLIVASVKHFGLLAINASNGKIVYQLKYDFNETQLPDLSPWMVSFDDRSIYVSNWQGNLLSCFNKNDGKLNWHLKSDKSGYSGPSVLIDNKILIGVNRTYKSGCLMVLDPSDGKIIIEKKCNYEERVYPIVYKNKFYFYTYDKYLNEYDIKTNRLTKLLKLTEENDLSGNQLFLSSGTLYFSDNSFNLNKFYIDQNKIEKIGQTEKSINEVFKYNDTDYFIY